MQRKTRSNTFIESSGRKTKESRKLTQSGKNKAIVRDESECSSEEDMPKTQRRSKRAKATDHANSTKKKFSKKTKASPSPPPSRRATRSSQNSKKDQKKYFVITSDEEEGSDSDGLEIVDAPLKAGQSRDSNFGEAESSSDEVLASSPNSVKKLRGTKNAPAILSEEEDSDDVGPVTPRRKRKRASSTPEEDSDEEMVVTQSRRRRAPDKKKQQQEQEDLEEDLEFLGRTPKKLRRKSPPRQMNARERALEALRRRRAGEKDAEPNLEEQPEGTQRRALYDTESESELESGAEDDEVEEDEDDLEGPADEPHSTVHQASTMAMFQEDAEDESFVVEDGDDTLGVPDEDVQIPLEFTSMSRMKGKDLFKYAVEWMVHKKLNPAFPSDDEIYALTFRKLDDEVKGLAGSKFTSSVWTPEFTRALHARPLIEISEISRAGADFIGDHCMACNRRGHPATFNIYFRGHPYHRSTLEDVADDYDSDEDEDDDSDDDKKSYDSRGNSVPPQDAVFHVGVFCKMNAQTAHALAHWRYHLNDWVVDWLAAEGHLDPDKIVERDGWKDKKKRKYANKVVDEMATKGEIKRLHQDFRSEIDTARNAKQAGWDRFSRD
ncbi:uncharacterized protein K452DRAFT_321768 [Aplosporella prunicola CBS 121167]|uniref:DUF4211 domain-containing protein n=1 Tax=Aplosporella prunicola CBS 121167 TaxID=1176127 RepID=A0A6A6B109_9PEZI|nr:uncharacterized protein K452DRAFT_321768 [Aplosporella prunicola CBS 121167]KAF2137536.1 hypothetical protein K452DRAFT_321768 [Aplosporella prunicola CBS 121167]